ncbi:hypothetical protein EMIT0111MI5_10663 [Burkholderia sp. IT-111MI5]
MNCRNANKTMNIRYSVDSEKPAAAWALKPGG